MRICLTINFWAILVFLIKKREREITFFDFINFTQPFTFFFEFYDVSIWIFFAAIKWCFIFKESIRELFVIQARNIKNLFGYIFSNIAIVLLMPRKLKNLTMIGKKLQTNFFLLSSLLIDIYVFITYYILKYYIYILKYRQVKLILRTF